MSLCYQDECATGKSSWSSTRSATGSLRTRPRRVPSASGGRER